MDIMDNADKKITWDEIVASFQHIDANDHALVTIENIIKYISDNSEYWDLFIPNRTIRDNIVKERTIELVQNLINAAFTESRKKFKNLK